MKTLKIAMVVATLSASQITFASCPILGHKTNVNRGAATAFNKAKEAEQIKPVKTTNSKGVQ